ncbi:heme biosynthesis protein HemY [Defluviimonas salinarum]|uniref:Tetratricopeptide repeat protein n=1 Tax=Defluviimonas salinarum TaxID=2992147 RepID=A0ABT3J1G9_9RHOB|nr:heme biosynthesis HemY N-terminal domain-containing protein [Defluviimonas salinarum]MCW3781531.1 tetratricopeptide repeat protein [Defluviimonas salinarum]
MIWSFIKIVIFVAVVAALTLGAGYLAETGSGIRITLANMEFTLGPVQAVIGVLLLVLLLWLALKIAGLLVAILRFLNGDETAVSRYFDRNRERKGYQALADGLMAVASGEGRLATSQAARAEKFLRRPELTNLIAAQAAELTGDTKRAAEVYKRLLADDRTRFVGVRGLMKQKLAEGDTETALKLAEKAYALKPKHEDVQDTLLQLQAAKGDWKGARQVLGTKLKQGLLPRDVHRRRDAVLALQEAKEVFSDDAPIEVREAAIEANRLSPDLIPAAVLAAQGYVQAGKPKYATRVLKKAWDAQPHPDLAAAFAAIEPEENPAERLKRFGTLLSLHPDHEETRLLRAELLIAAEDFPAARRALGDLTEAHPTARSLTIRAAIARGEGEDDAFVRGWLTRALTASRGPQWVCDKCHNIQADWAPTCDNCGGFDTLSWREPPKSAVQMPNGSEMLPLIVGSPAEAEVKPSDGAESDDSEDCAEDALILDEEVGRKAQI